MTTPRIKLPPRPQSPQFIAANRRNALRSTGPLSQEGKAIARLNGLTHGLTCSLELLPGADQQKMLPRLIAECEWRLKHARDVENGWFAGTIGTEKTFAGHVNRLLRLTLYEQRIARRMEILRDRLHRLQSDRPPSEAKAKNGFGNAN